MKLQTPPERLKRPAGEVSDHEAVIVTPLYNFGTGFRVLKDHFLVEAGLEQGRTHICCLAEKTLIVERPLESRSLKST